MEDEDFLFELFAGSAPPLPPDLLRQQFATRVRQYRDQFGEDRRVLLMDGQPAGLLWVAAGEALTLIVDLAIHPSQRRRGLAREAILSLPSDVPIRLSVARDNTPAVRLYLSLGFQAVHEDEMYLRMEKPVN